MLELGIEQQKEGRSSGIGVGINESLKMKL
jgi:hypothetical protein